MKKRMLRMNNRIRKYYQGSENHLMRSGSQIYKDLPASVEHIANKNEKLGQILNIEVVKICWALLSCTLSRL